MYWLDSDILLKYWQPEDIPATSFLLRFGISEIQDFVIAYENVKIGGPLATALKNVTTHRYEKNFSLFPHFFVIA